MARIRSIKPEFWDSPSTAKAGPWARLLYLAMWNWADDWGIGDASPSRLRAFAFPNDEVSAADYPRLVTEVQNAYGVVFFEHLGRRYYAIPTFGTHQRTEKKAKPREDLIAAAANACNDGDSEPQLPWASESPTPDADSPSPEVGSRNRGSRNRGTGEVERAQARDTPADLPEPFLEFCNAYPGNVQTKPAFAVWAGAVKRAGGYRTVVDGAFAYADWIDRSGTEAKYIRNAVKWLNEDGWRDELKAPTRASPRSTTDDRVTDAFTLAQQLRAEQEPSHSTPKAIGR